MGLLDEAIREHLELKRRRGGDPSEIARVEHEALAPVFSDRDGDGDAATAAPEAYDHAAPDQHAEPVSAQAAEQPPADFSSVGEETAELDMQAVLGSGEMLTEEHPAPAPDPRAAREEEFDWEAPGGAREAPPEPGPGQERLSFE